MGNTINPERMNTAVPARRASEWYWTLLSIAILPGALLVPSPGAAQEVTPQRILLARIKMHMKDAVGHLPNYTCVESITRYRKEARRGWFLPLDRVLLEVGYNGAKERYNAFDQPGNAEEDPAAFIAAGMIANGLFGITVNNLFATDAAVFTAEGEDVIGGRKTVKYDFRIPSLISKFRVSLVEGSGTVGMEGSFWADPQSFDLVRLDVQAAEIPSDLPLEVLQSTANYARTRIGDSDSLLVQNAGLYIRKTTGLESYNRFDFTHCRVFDASSSVRFDWGGGEPLASSPPPAAKSNNGNRVPALLSVTIALTTPVTDQMNVGELIEGRILGDVKAKGSVVLPDGARVRGRIRRLDLDADGKRFIVGLEFTSVEVEGTPVRFFADLLTLEKRRGISVAKPEVGLLPNRSVGSILVTIPEAPGVASFFVEGNRFVLPAGLRTVWRTRGPLRGTVR
jgi:hypothetical protein